MSSPDTTTVASFEDMYTDGTYLELHPTWQAEDSPWKASQIDTLLKRNNIQPQTICEVGCGAGEILVQLSELLPDSTQFTGYEISPQAVELAQSRVRDNISFYLADLLEEPTAPFDLVLCIDVIEHVEDYYGFIRKLRTKGTYKIFHIPLDLSARAMFSTKHLLERRASVGHIHYYTPETALAALRDTGYTVLDYMVRVKGIDKKVKNPSYKTHVSVLGRRIVGKFDRGAAARIFGGGSIYILAQ